MEIEGLDQFVQIGSGGFGAVYRARDASHGRSVAVKVLDAAPDEEGRRRFDRERRAMGTLSGHPNIAVVHQSGIDDSGRLYLVMEYLTGGSMADRLKDGPMPEDEVVQIGLALADALERAHELGVLHLDIKPDNVLLSDFGVPKLVDFGIASFLNDEAMTTTIRATPAYAAPEVLDGRQPSVAADVYGLAVTLYSLLTGETPYGKTSTGALSMIRDIATQPVPIIDSGDVSPGLRRLLADAMAKEPDERPASIAEFRSRLAGIDSEHAGNRSATPSHPQTTIIARPDEGPSGHQPQANTAADHGSAPSIDVPAAPTPSPASPRGSTPMRIAIVAVVVLAVAGVFLATRGGGNDDGDQNTAATTSTTTTPEATPTSQATTTAPSPTTASSTTLAPTTAPPPPSTIATPGPNDPMVSDAFWSSNVIGGEAVDDTVVLAAGSPSLCLNWQYTNVPVGAPYTVTWRIGGTIVDRMTSTGTNQGDTSGAFWACANGDPGLEAGVYEAQWTVNGDRVFTHAFRVGPTQGTTITFENRSGRPTCMLFVDPAGVPRFGINRLPNPIPPGGSFPVGVSAGEWDAQAVDCQAVPIGPDRRVDAREDIEIVLR